MKLSVVAVGRVKDQRVGGLCREYRERLGHHLSVDTREIKKGDRSQPGEVMSIEAQRLLEKAPSRALTVALDEGGKQLSSRQVAQKLNRWMVDGRKEVAFYIGGAHGLDRSVRKSADRVWSLSKMTFPHDIARMLLWEQLYRAMTIIRGEPYHK